MMLIPARTRLIIAVTVYAFATLAHAQAPTKADDLIKYLQSLPPGTPVSIESSTTTSQAGGEGASAKAEGEKLDQTIDSGAPTVTLPGGIGADGGNTKATQHSEISGTLWYTILLWVAGIGCLLGAAWKLLKTKPPEIDTAIGLGVAGGVLIACAIWPFLLYLLIVAVVLAGVSHFLPDKAKAILAGVTGAAQTSAREADTNLSALDELCEAIANDEAASAAVRAHLDRRVEDPDFPLLSARLRKAGMKFSGT